MGLLCSCFEQQQWYGGVLCARFQQQQRIRILLRTCMLLAGQLFQQRLLACEQLFQRLVLITQQISRF